MSKKSIMKRAAEAARRKSEAQRVDPSQNTSAEPPSAEPQSEARTGQGALGAVDAAKIASEVTDAVCARLERLLPIYARLAAADTLHTSEKRATVIRRAIAEGIEATDLIREGLSHAAETI